MNLLKAQISKLMKDSRVRYLLIGGMNTFLGFFVFAILQITIFGPNGYLWSLLSAQIVVSFVAFSLYRKFVFIDKSRYFENFFKFQTVYVIPLSANIFVLPIFVAVLGIPPLIAQAIITFVMVVITYILHKYFTFKKI